MAGVRVFYTLYPMQGGATTLDDGTYSLTGLEPGSYYVQILIFDRELAPEFYKGVFDYHEATLVEVKAGEITTDIDFTLIPSGKMTGVVTRATDGQPLDGVCMEASLMERPQPQGDLSLNWLFLPNPPRSECSREDGSFVITGLAPGTYRVAPARSSPDTDFVAPPRENIDVVSGQTTANIDEALLAGARISGVVTRADDGQPVPGLTVTAGGREAVTKADGSYLIAKLLPGAYTVHLYHLFGSELLSEYYPNAYEERSAVPVAVDAGQHLTGIDFRLETGGRIAGMVRRETDGQPVTGVSVHAGGNAATTGDNGAYTIIGLVPGSYEVAFYSEGMDFLSEYYDNTTNYAAATPVTVSIGQTTAGIDFRLDLAGKITGTGTRAADGQPLAGLRVGIGDSRETFTTGADGSYTISGLLPGSYPVYLRTCSIINWTKLRSDLGQIWLQRLNKTAGVAGLRRGFCD